MAPHKIAGERVQKNTSAGANLTKNLCNQEAWGKSFKYLVFEKGTVRCK